LFLRANLLILENGLTKTLTGQTYLQKALNSQNRAIKVGNRISISTVIPDILGLATRVVEKVASSKNTMSLNQSLVRAAGHFKKRPESRLLYSLVLPFAGVKKDLRCNRSPKKGKGQTVHHILPKKGVNRATSKNSHTAHISKTPRFLPDILVPNKEVRITT
jgi:hypothetical protein